MIVSQFNLSKGTYISKEINNIANLLINEKRYISSRCTFTDEVKSSLDDY